MAPAIGHSDMTKPLFEIVTLSTFFEIYTT